VDCALIVGKHPYTDPMQAQFGEGMLQDKRDSFSSKVFAEWLWTENADRQGRAIIMGINVSQSDFTDKPAIRVLEGEAG
jgi:hypothetical protein